MLKLQYWPPDAKRWLTGKDSGAGKDWWQKWVTEDDMVGCQHRLSGMSLSKLQEIVKDREAWSAVFMGLQRVRQDLVIE